LKEVDDKYLNYSDKTTNYARNISSQNIYANTSLPTI